MLPMQLRTLFCLFSAKEIRSKPQAHVPRKQVQEHKTSQTEKKMVHLSNYKKSKLPWAIYQHITQGNSPPNHYKAAASALYNYGVKCETIHNHCLKMMKIRHFLKRELITSCLLDIQWWMHILIA